ncbi:uncharacterized protein LOC112057924 [Bicyclus anynana]|uniref:Uncharacterized protein LOC112057924 n=1 Tax=Bicyclus anynana TaxID=110368 RepID=A0ABM3LPT5_BICAN|nr:uncharacterized protein LOC112057924 [Bicyclus anynana]
MSLIKLLKLPSKLFKKDAYSYCVLHVYVKVIDEKLHYIALRPSASIFQLRQKVWHLLNLPDYCEEIIILKTEKDQEIPLTDLRKGNDPQHPYIMEVWLPGKQNCLSSIHNMLTMGDSKTVNNLLSQDHIASNNNMMEDYNFNKKSFQKENSHTTINLYDSMLLNKQCSMEKQDAKKPPEYKNSELSCKMSSSSIFFKLHARKSKDNFVNILLKIQSDIATLGSKLSDLENRIHV